VWIEFHNELLGHPKVDRLVGFLKISRIEALGILAGLWLWTSKYADHDGDLTKFEHFEIARGINWQGDPDVLVNALVQSEFLDKDDQSLRVHDWEKYGTRILKQSKERQKRYRGKEQQKDGSVQAGGSAAYYAARDRLKK